MGVDPARFGERGIAAPMCPRAQSHGAGCASGGRPPLPLETRLLGSSGLPLHRHQEARLCVRVVCFTYLPWFFYVKKFFCFKKQTHGGYVDTRVSETYGLHRVACGSES